MAALNVLEHLVAVLQVHDAALIRGFTAKVGSLHCPTCGDSRKMNLRRLWRKNGQQFLVSKPPDIDVERLLRLRAAQSSPSRTPQGTTGTPHIEVCNNDDRGLSQDKNHVAAQLAPSLHQLTCVECEGIFTALIFPGPQGPELAIFPNKAGGLALLR